jgi:predicted transglutaminase-like cysteine proteinase
MGNLTRREVLKAGSTAAVTALLNPLLGKAEGEKEGNNVTKPEPVQAPFEEICFMNATALVEMLRTKKVSSVEVVKAHLSQIARVNQKVNAIVTLVEAGTVAGRGTRGGRCACQGKLAWAFAWAADWREGSTCH